MQMKKRKYAIRMGIFLLMLITGAVAALGSEAEAGGTAAVNSNIDAFDTLRGDYKYIRDQYYECYKLDQEELGTFDFGAGIANFLANFLFSIIKFAAKVTVTLFYYCMDFDIAAMFKDQINGIQGALHESIFEPLFILAFCFTGVVLLKKFVKRDLMGAYGQMVRVVVLVVLSILIVQNSSAVLTTSTGIAKYVGTQALTGVNGGEQSISSYAAQNAGVLWVSLVHQPWITFEFDGDPVDSATVEAFLNPANAPGTDNRKNLIKNYQYGDAFSKDRAGGKLGVMFFYIFPFLFKCLIYGAISLIQLVFQFLAVFYILLAPIILILSMFPGYEGMIGSWIRKILESQLSIVLITFLMGLLIKFDVMLNALAVQIGWMLVIVIQVVVCAGVILKREALLGALTKMQRAVSTPAYAMNSMRSSGNLEQGARSVQRTARQTQRAAKRVANSKPVKFAVNSVMSLGRTVKDEIVSTGEAGMRAVNGNAEFRNIAANIHIDPKTGKLMNAKKFEEYKEKKAQEAEARWQRRVENYGMPKAEKKKQFKDFTREPKRYTSQDGRSQKSSANKRTSEAPKGSEMPKVVNRPRSSTPPPKPQNEASNAARRASETKKRYARIEKAANGR